MTSKNKQRVPTIFERFMSTRNSSSVDNKLIPEQAGFRPEKFIFLSGLVRYLTQYIEVEHEKNLGTVAVVIDFSASYYVKPQKASFEGIWGNKIFSAHKLGQNSQAWFLGISWCPKESWSQTEWRVVELEHCYNPQYLGVILDWTLSFRVHCIGLKGKSVVEITTWRGGQVQPGERRFQVLCSTELDLGFSVTEQEHQPGGIDRSIHNMWMWSWMRLRV